MRFSVVVLVVMLLKMIPGNVCYKLDSSKTKESFQGIAVVCNYNEVSCTVYIFLARYIMALPLNALILYILLYPLTRK